MSTVQDRLGFLMKEAKLKSLRVAAERYGIGYEVFKKIASHNASDPRNLTPDQAQSIAKFHKVSAGWLLFEEGDARPHVGIKLIGKIGAGQEMMIFETNEETIPGNIAGADAAVLEVEGDSMWPLARDGDYIFVGPGRSGKEIDSLIGEECAVYLDDQRRFFKVIERGSLADHYDLVSHNAPTIRNVRIVEAGPLLAVKRRSTRKVSRKAARLSGTRNNSPG